MRMTKPINIIVAVDSRGGFGKDGKIPWHFSEDLKHFKTTTSGNACIMGRNTYVDMLNMVKHHKKDKDAPIKELLPNRQCIVVTKHPNLEMEGGAITATSLNDAINLVEDGREAFVVGGEKMYIEAISNAETIYLTVVKENEEDGYDCDRFFPVDYMEEKFQIVEGKQTDELYFMKYERKPQPHFQFSQQR